MKSTAPCSPRRRPEQIAAAVVQPLRELLGVPRAIVNRFDLAAGEVEWVAAAGRRRVHTGPGVRYSIRLMGDVEALRRGETQVVDVQALPTSPETAALLASGVRVYMVVPMLAGGELLGRAQLRRAGERRFPKEHINIVREVAAQLAIAITQANLLSRVKDHAAELESRVRARTAELDMLHSTTLEISKARRQHRSIHPSSAQSMRILRLVLRPDLASARRHLTAQARRRVVQPAPAARCLPRGK